ncbi:cupin-like domain-containing protein [Catellatospora sichuanensis]|uniref:cupin-like domain-containing protein n=1 Tax=Catellatospora sichuanensis TaxID=1969805 RepID=UPI0016434B15|nr:cupin-like domain-containing protein [Catellatospora sichuanensis]
MTSVLNIGKVDVRESLGAEEFYRDYVNKKPVLMKGAIAGMPAVSQWSVPYLTSLAPELPVRLKTGYLAEGNTVTWSMRQYSEFVDDLVEGRTTTDGPPPYLHDLPLFSMIPALRADIEPFPAHMLPKFFRDQWWKFPQFFVGPPDAMTPLHFDSLQTHNLFFQIHGSKRFLIVDPEDRQYCYTYNWRWSHIDAENPDLDRHPLYQRARVRECVVETGDLLYMPPGALHHVRSLTTSISFNVDWHDKRSALRGLAAVRHGMPVKNLRYNTLFALGVCAGVPLRVLEPALKSYFYYVS